MGRSSRRLARRAALAEMRQLLGALRPDAAAELVPQPQLTDIRELADATTRAGSPVRVELDAAAAAASPIAQLTAYRIVREALSNAVLHAPGASTAASIRLLGDAPHMSVRNAPPPGQSAGSSTRQGDSTSPDRGCVACGSA